MAGELMTLDQALLELENLIAIKEPSWTGHWEAELAQDLASLLKPPDAPNDGGLAERYSPEVRGWQHGESAEVWQNYQKAALFLRLEMEEGHLPVHVRDPSEDNLLPLLPEDWLPWTPEDRLDPDFLTTGNYGVRGRDGTRFYAELGYALVYRREFDQWLINHLIHPFPKARQRETVKRAIYALWDGYPPVQDAKIRDRKIHEWISKNEPESYRPDKFAVATIKRALAEIQQEQLTLLRHRSGS